MRTKWLKLATGLMVCTIFLAVLFLWARMHWTDCTYLTIGCADGTGCNLPAPDCQPAAWTGLLFVLPILAFTGAIYAFIRSRYVGAKWRPGSVWTAHRRALLLAPYAALVVAAVATVLWLQLRPAPNGSVGSPISSSEPASPDTSASPILSGQGCHSGLVPGSLIVQYQPSATSEQLQAAVQSAGGVITRHLDALNELVVAVKPGTEQAAIAKLKDQAVITSVQQDRTNCPL